MIHETAIIDKNVIIGKNCNIWHYTHIMPNIKIGNNVTIGQNCFIAADIPNGCKIQNNVSIYHGVILREDVFIGPSAIFTNVINPRAFLDKKSEIKETIIGKGATIGAGAILICGVIVGEYALIGAGSVVTRDILPYNLVVGNPCRCIGRVTKEGESIKFEHKIF